MNDTRFIRIINRYSNCGIVLQQTDLVIIESTAAVNSNWIYIAYIEETVNSTEFNAADLIRKYLMKRVIK